MTVRRMLITLAALSALALTAPAAPAQTILATGDAKTTSWGPDHVGVFVKATNNTVWHRNYTGGWGPWQNLGGDIAGEPAVVSWGPGHMAVFARFRADNYIYTRAFMHGQWGDWHRPIGGNPDPDNPFFVLEERMQGSPRAYSPGPGYITLVARGQDNKQYRYEHGDLLGWCCTTWNDDGDGGYLTSDPEPLSMRIGHRDIFHRGTDARLYHRWQASGGWSAWERLGLWQFNGNPRGISWGNDHLEVMVRGLDGSLGRIAFVPGSCGGWCNWENLGGTITEGDPEPVSMRAGHTAAYVHGPNHAVYDKWHQYSAWGNWWRMSPEWWIHPGATPSPSSWGDGNITVAWRDPDGAVDFRMYNQHQWGPDLTLGRPGENVPQGPPSSVALSTRWGIAQNREAGRWPDCADATWQRDTGWKLRTGIFRVSIPWNATVNDFQFNRVLNEVQCAKRNHEQVLLTIDHSKCKMASSPCEPLAAPSVETYRMAVQTIVDGLHPWVDVWGPANEPNGHWLGGAPGTSGGAVLAGYYQALRGILDQRYGAGNGVTRMTGPDFLDAYNKLDSTAPNELLGGSDGSSNVRDWVMAYRAAGGGFGIAAAFHPYGGVHRKDAKSVNEYIGALPAGTKVWFTEIGAFWSKSNDSPDGKVTLSAQEHAVRVKYLVDLANAKAATVTRIYYFDLMSSIGVNYAGSHWDTALINGDGTRRPAWYQYCAAIAQAQPCT